jgi:T-complex protein 1 subunit gamma
MIRPQISSFSMLILLQSATLLLRVDDIVSARRPGQEGGGGVQTMGEGAPEGMEQ